MSSNFFSNIKTCSSITTPNGIQVYYSGPDLSEGKLPALFYFALSGHASLSMDPYNQPAAFLLPYQIRVFSISLPYHHNEGQFQESMKDWAREIATGHDFLSEFGQSVIHAIKYLIDSGYINEDKMAIAGLSRGGFIAAHIAALDSRFKTILGYAPLSKLTCIKEFTSLTENALACSLNLDNLLPKLIGRHLRFYIGNRDTRVGTDHCFDFISRLAEASYQKSLRTSPVELIIGPSQGHHGHGTLPHVFKDGIFWLCNQLALECNCI